MNSRTLTSRMKAAAIAALMCLSVAATTVTVVNRTINVAAVSLSVGETLAVDEKYRGKTADIAEDGIESITFTLKADYTGNFSFGFGIGIAEDPYWMEYNGKTKTFDSKGAGMSVAVKEGENVTVTIDVSDLDLKYADPYNSKYDGEWEFRNYYSGEGDGTVTLVSVEANSSATDTTGDTDTTDTTETTDPDAKESHQKTSGVTQNKTTNSKWSFTDNKDGTGTMTATLARQIDLQDSPYLLTAGYDEDYYAELGVSPIEGKDPINSHKFNWGDFGLSSASVGAGVSSNHSITVESLTATITSKTPFKRFMYGGGIGVVNKSPADTEYAKQVAGIEGKDNAGYWYNDMGEYMEEEDDGSYEWFVSQGVEFGITPGFGYDLTSDTSELGSWFKTTWDVPEEKSRNMKAPAVFPSSTGTARQMPRSMRL